MSVEFEAVAGMVDAGLVAKAIEGDSADGAAAQRKTCANCGAILYGAFCHGCGQKAHVHRSVLHLGEEVLHGLLHFDTKAWRTLPMLTFRPGQLTRRYLDGQRARFVSPLALFLFMMFLMFFVASLTSGKHLNTPELDKHGIAELNAKADSGRAAVAKAETALKQAGADRDRKELEEELADAREELAGIEQAQALVGGALDKVDLDGPRNEDGSLVKSDNFNINYKSGVAAVDQAIAKAEKNPELALYKLKSAATKYTFLLVPISLPFVWLMFFWRRGVTMYDHAVFVLYSLSFMALMFIVAFLLKFAGLKSTVVWLILLAPPLHMFVQLRGAYTLGVGGALWRTMALLIAASIVFMLYLAVVMVLAVK